MEQPRIVYNKLVRDKIPDIIRSQGRHPETRILSDDEYRKFLRLKLVEEAGETHAAKERLDFVKECGDILEVFESLLRFEGVSMEEVLAVKERRRAERGGFDGRVYLIADAPISETVPAE